MIDLKKITKVYTLNQELTVRAVVEVDLQVAEGEFLVITGRSGSGKTTCLRMIAGFDHPNSGRIELFGRDVTGLPPYDRDVHTVFQDYALFPHMNVFTNIAFGLQLQRRPAAEIAERVQQMLELVQLTGYEGRYPGQLSGGQQQRVAIARALITDPAIIVADEPTGDLDRKSAGEILALLRQLNAEMGKTIVMVTHDWHAVESARHVVHLEKGELVDAPAAHS
jgi:putative ABC transport system ATP-binding protein